MQMGSILLLLFCLYYSQIENEPNYINLIANNVAITAAMVAAPATVTMAKKLSLFNNGRGGGGNFSNSNSKLTKSSLVLIVFFDVAPWIGRI
ncbi:hypothetical protein DERP_000272 [Dermatophagoides pteronyssinus]|uniref:Uncharacterized protein n=1 Tax=Dermatophagoides pteronyssinus TaxID=6956 RepID=A0ABQ8J018_DERPT|nr:hypothetical protein DERP_000272 [Dermatophagoides pteronyssinus]